MNRECKQENFITFDECPYGILESNKKRVCTYHEDDCYAELERERELDDDIFEKCHYGVYRGNKRECYFHSEFCCMY